MGNLSEVMSMIPGLPNNMRISEKDVDETQIERFKAIIKSMTMYEREHPDVIKSSRRKRIAAGSGTSIQDVNRLLKQFEQTKEMMKMMKNGKMGKGGRRFPF